MPEHTPGPWEYVPPRGPEDRNLAHVKGADGIEIICVNDEGHYEGLRAPDARLIAAAPELWSLLETMPPVHGSGAAWIEKRNELLLRIRGLADQPSDGASDG